MKKSQVLAALALAFALGLGVVAPATETFAYVVDANDKLITNSELITDLNKTIADAQKIKTAAEHTNYAALVAAINGDTAPASGKSLNAVKTEQKEALLTALTSSVTGFDSSNYENATYEAVYSDAVAARKNAQDINGGTSQPYTTLNKAITDADTAVEAAEVDTVTLIQTALTGTGWKGAPYVVNNFVTTADDGTKTANLAGAITYAKSKAPEYNFYSNLVDALNKANDVVGAQADTEKYTVAQANAVLANLKAAMEGKTTPADGTGEGENKPGDDEKDPSAPDTGILANTEGSASTTLAMVAGIATALTAAGAGVVAYRNARRSSRK